MTFTPATVTRPTRKRIALADLIGKEAAAQAQLTTVDYAVTAIQRRQVRARQQREEEDLLLLY